MWKFLIFFWAGTNIGFLLGWISRNALKKKGGKMSSLTRISPTVGDINFEFNDSCNCCSGRRKKKAQPGTMVYIDSKGNVKKFDVKKAHDKMESMERAVNNLKKTVSQFCTEANLNKKTVFKKIKTQSQLELKGPEKIDLQKVNHVNQILREEFSRRS